MGDNGQEWGEYRLMILDRLGRIEDSIKTLTSHIDGKYVPLEARVAALERDSENQKGRHAVWSSVLGFLAGIAGTVIVRVLFK